MAQVAQVGQRVTRSVWQIGVSTRSIQAAHIRNGLAQVRSGVAIARSCDFFITTMLSPAALQWAAAQGNKHALMLLRMENSQVQAQDESDRRWRNMCAYIKTAKPTTGAEWLMACQRYGFEPAQHVPASKLRKEMDFPTWMAACGGYSTSASYPAQGEPDAPAQCDNCEQQGATMRCSWCGEWYCSQACFEECWATHKPICMQAADGRLCSDFGTIVPKRPVPLWTAVEYARTFGLPPPPSSNGPAETGRSSSCGNGGSSGSSSGATAGLAEALARGLNLQQQQQHQEAVAPDTQQQQDQHNSGPSKSAKRNAKRREKEKRDKQQAAAAAAEAGGL